MGGRARSSLVLAVCGSLLLGGCSNLTGAFTESPSDDELLQAVSLTEQDAAADASFLPYEGGTEVDGRTSLDLCFGDFPSEGLRVGRTQVGIGDPTGETWVSSEAILYSTPEQAQAAMAELRTAREDCPSTLVDPPQAGRAPLVWVFQDSPDADWPDEPGVRRQAYAFTVTDDSGRTLQSTATYLQRGRMILALYANPPQGPAVVLRNAPEPARFTEVMANRLSGLPEQSLLEANPDTDAGGPGSIDA